MLDQDVGAHPWERGERAAERQPLGPGIPTWKLRGRQEVEKYPGTEVLSLCSLFFSFFFLMEENITKCFGNCSVLFSSIRGGGQ